MRVTVFPAGRFPHRRWMHRRRFSFVSAITVIACASRLSAQLPAPQLDSVFPAEVQVGTSVEVTLTGSELNDVTALLCDRPGIAASKLEGLRFRIVAAADCEPGPIEVRAVNRLGITNARPFLIGRAPVQVSDGKNLQMTSARSLEQPCAVHGRGTAEQRDYYRLRPRAGERLHFSCVAFHLDSPMDPVITLTDIAGRTLRRADDDRDRDATLTWDPPGDAEVFIVVHDKTFAGGAAYQYRLSVHAAAQPDEAFPNDVLLSCEDRLAKPALSEETEPNNDRATAQSIVVPVEIAGQFDDDYFAFDADPARTLWIDVAAEAGGAGSDPLVVIEKITKNPNGEEGSKQVLELDDQGDLASPPFWQSASRNPSGRFVPDEKARYRLMVRDRFGGNSRYHLRIAHAAGDFDVVALGESPGNEEKKVFRWQPNLRRGGSTFFHVAVRRRNYDGELTLGVFGLPGDVRASGAIPSGSSVGVLTFHADAAAKPWAGFIRVFADGGGVMREVHGMSYRWSVDNRDNQRLAPRIGRLAIGVADEPPPISIRPAETRTWQVAIGEKLEVPLQFTFPSSDIRAKGEWQIVPIGIPGLKKPDVLKVDAAAANEAKLVLNFQKDGNTFQPGTFTLWPRASGTVSYKENPKAKARDFKHVEFGEPIRIHLTEAQPAPPAK